MTRIRARHAMLAFYLALAPLTSFAAVGINDTSQTGPDINNGPGGLPPGSDPRVQGSDTSRQQSGHEGTGSGTSTGSEPRMGGNDSVSDGVTGGNGSVNDTSGAATGRSTAPGTGSNTGH